MDLNTVILAGYLAEDPAPGARKHDVCTFTLAFQGPFAAPRPARGISSPSSRSDAPRRPASGISRRGRGSSWTAGSGMIAGGARERVEAPGSPSSAIESISSRA